MILMGNFQHTLDENNRIRLPADFRKAMGTEYCVMPGTNGCLFVYKADESTGIVASLLGLDSFDPDQSLKFMQIMSMGRKVTADSQGRFVLPEELKKLVGIDRDVRIIGAGNKAAIWSEAHWQELFGHTQTTAAVDNLYKDLQSKR